MLCVMWKFWQGVPIFLKSGIQTVIIQKYTLAHNIIQYNVSINFLRHGNTILHETVISMQNANIKQIGFAVQIMQILENLQSVRPWITDIFKERWTFLKTLYQIHYSYIAFVHTFHKSHIFELGRSYKIVSYDNIELITIINQ